MNLDALILLEALKADYIELVRSKSGSPFPFSGTIGNEFGTIYVRKMAATNYFCLANLNFSDECCGQGVLSSFIDHIKENPFSFDGISVELIHNPRLAAKLKSDGFELIPLDPISDSQAPTLVFLLN